MNIVKDRTILERFFSFKCAVCNRTLWFFSPIFGGIVEINLNTLKAQVIWQETGDRLLKSDQYHSCVYYKDKLYFAPYNAPNILIYDLKTGIAERVFLSLSEIGCDEFAGIFRDCAIVNDFIYFAPGRSRAIVELNPINHDISYYDFSGVVKNEIKEESSICGSLKIYNDNILLLPFWQTGGVLCFDSIKKSYSAIETGNKVISDLEIINDILWCVLKDEPVIEAVSLTGEKIISVDFSQMRATNNIGGRFVQSFGKKLIIIPIHGSALIEVDTENGEVKTPYYISDEPVDIMKTINSNSVNSFMFQKLSDNEIINFDANAGEYVIYNVLNRKENRYIFNLSQSSVEELFSCFKFAMKNEIENERPECNLKDFLTYIATY